MERGGGLRSLRDANQRRVIEALGARGVASRADIARATGLSRTTVSSLVGDLKGAGLLVERQADSDQDQSVGRPPVLLSFDRSAGAVVGLDFGHSHIGVVVGDLSHTVLAESWRDLDVDSSANEGLDMAAELVEDALELARRRARPGTRSGNGPARPDHVAERHRRSRRRSCPAGLGSTPRPRCASGSACACASRTTRTSERWPSSCGAPAAAPATSSSSACAPGSAARSCSTAASTAARAARPASSATRRCARTARSAAAATAAASRPSRARWPWPAAFNAVRGDEVPIAELIELAHRGDSLAQRVIADAGRSIGIALANLCNVFNPERAIIGGDLSRRR